MSVPPRRHFVFEIISTTDRQTHRHTHRVTYGGGAHLKKHKNDISWKYSFYLRTTLVAVFFSFSVRLVHCITSCCIHLAFFLGDNFYLQKWLIICSAFEFLNVSEQILIIINTTMHSYEKVSEQFGQHRPRQANFTLHFL